MLFKRLVEPNKLKVCCSNKIQLYLIRTNKVHIKNNLLSKETKESEIHLTFLNFMRYLDVPLT